MTWAFTSYFLIYLIANITASVIELDYGIYVHNCEKVTVNCIMITIFLAHRLRKFYSTPPPSGFYLILLYGTESPFDSVSRRGLVQNLSHENLLYLHVYFDVNHNYFHVREVFHKAVILQEVIDFQK